MTTTMGGRRYRPGGRIIHTTTPQRPPEPTPIHDGLVRDLLLLEAGLTAPQTLDIRGHGLPWLQHWVSG